MDQSGKQPWRGPSGDHYHPPRIRVTPSMLYAHNQMRSKSEHTCDPLHLALYLDPDRDLQRRIWLPILADPRMMEEIPKGTVFFWDSEDPVHLMIPPPQGPPRQDRSAGASTPLSPALNFQEYLRKNLPIFRPNHFHGEKAYANYGYVLINGNWVDPDSEGAVFDASQNRLRSDRTELPGSRTFGPRVMSEEEQNKFYKQYISDVTDEVDGEGDPRAWRIDSATFARWAAGAAKGDRYEAATIEAQVEISKLEYDRGESKTSPLREPQFDLETGSVLSCIYDLESSPRPLQIPGGVDIIRRPLNFCRSYPQVGIDLDWAAFGPPGENWPSRDSLNRSTTPPAEIFSSEAACREFDNINNGKTGEENYQAAREFIQRLQMDKSNRYSVLAQKYSTLREAEGKKSQLQQEIFFLQNRLVADAAAAASGELLRRGQHRRYFDERIDRERLIIGRTLGTNDRLNMDIQKARELIKNLEQKRGELLQQLGVLSVEHIPGLIPEKNPSDSEL